MQQFVSERLMFREYQEEDFPLFYELFSNEQVMRYAWIDRYEDEAAARLHFQTFLHHNLALEQRQAYEFGVFCREDGGFAGYADIEVHCQSLRGGCGEIGYFLRPDCWGQGYATEISKAVLQIAFEHLKLHRVEARCEINNRQSERIMQKIGMQQEGVFRQARLKNGLWEDELRYAILLEEWCNGLK